MDKNKEIVINTDPLISMITAQQGLNFLDSLYDNVFVPKKFYL